MKKQIDVLIATNNKRELETRALLYQLINESISAPLRILLVVDQWSDNLKKLADEVRNLDIEIYQKPGSKLEKWLWILPKIKSKYLLLIDDDIEISSQGLISTLYKYLDNQESCLAVSPFINEKYSKPTMINKFMTYFHTKFRMWDVDDYKWKVYSIYGKGWATFEHKLPETPVMECEWLSVQCLLIRSREFIHRLRMMNEIVVKLPGYLGDRKNMWAIDLFLTYKLAQENSGGLVFYPQGKVVHHGYNKTAFGFYRRIKMETFWGYWYYKYLLQEGSLIKGYIVPNLVRILDYCLICFVGERPFLTIFKNLYYLLKSYLALMHSLLKSHLLSLHNYKHVRISVESYKN